MKRLFSFLLLMTIVSLQLSAEEGWMISTALELPCFAGTFSPGISLKADAILFPWSLDEPGEDGYGFSMEGGILFPIRRRFTGPSPYFKLGAMGRKDISEKYSASAKAHVMYALIGEDLPGNGIGKRRRVYFQNIGASLSASFVIKLTSTMNMETGISVMLLMPLETGKAESASPEFAASLSTGLSWRL